MGSTVGRVALAALLLCAAAAHAEDCNSLVQTVTVRGSQPNRVAGPVVWTGAEYGVVKNETNDFRSISFALFNPELVQIGPDVPLATSTRAGVLHLFWTGSEFGVFYQTPGLQLMLQRVSAAGVPIGGPVAIAPNHGNQPQDELDITWDPVRNAYAIVRTIQNSPTESGLWLIIANVDGSTRVDQLISFFPALQAGPRIAAASNGNLGIIFQHATARGYHFLLVDPRNVPGATQLFSTAGRNARMTSRGSELAVILQVANGSRTEVDWVRISANGVVTQPETFLFAGRGVDVVPLSLVWNANGSEWGLAYLDAQLGTSVFPGDYRLRRFTTSGSLIDDTLFSPDPLRNLAMSPYPILWNGASYVSAPSFFVSRTEGSDSYLMRHCPLVATAGSDLAFPPLYSTVQFRASASGGSPAYTYLWDFGDLSEKLTGPTVQHRYTRTGAYTVTIVVSDAAGGKVIRVLTVNVVVPKQRAVRR